MNELWYRDYEKGKPFYTVSSLDVLQKNYYAGWLQIKHYDDSITDWILTMQGGQMRANSPTDMRRRWPAFPEEELAVVVSQLKEFNQVRAASRVKSAQEALDKAVQNQAKAGDWTPKTIDFKEDEEYDWFNPNYPRFDDEMYVRVELL